MKRLTTQSIASLKGKTARYDTPDVGGVPGLAIRVTPTGRKTWTFRYRNELGKQRRITIGQFGDRAGIGLKDARDMARGILANVSKGQDPAKEKQDARRAEKLRDIKTLNDLWLSYRARNGETKRSAEFERNLWDRLVSPSLGDLDVNDINKGRITRRLEAIGDGVSGTPITANRVHALLRQVLNHAVTIDLFPSSPMTGLSMPYSENPRDRVMTDSEIQTFWNGIDDVTQVSPAVKCAFKLALLTGQRRAEISGMTKQELNLKDKLWSLPKNRVKNNTAHDVPLSELAVALIDRAVALSGNSPYLFPSPRNNQQPINPKALTRAWARASEQLNLKGVVLHDFRRTCATGLQKLGVRLEVTEAILNHKSGSVSGIVAIYQRHDWKDEKKHALESWAAKVKSISENTNDDNVLNFPAAAQ